MSQSSPVAANKLATEVEPTCAQTQRRPRILIAENEVGIRTLLLEVLKPLGMPVEAVGDGLSARQQLQTEGRHDLLICDLMMPGLSGLELLAELAQSQPSLPVFVISGYVDPRVDAKLKSFPQVRAVFRKPFDLFKFALAVQKLFEVPEART